MSNESMLPPDVQEEVARQNRNRPPGGIGSAAPENATTAHQRSVAMGQEEEPEQQQAKAKKEEETNDKVCSNIVCREETKPEWAYCARCGTDLVQGGAAKRLGITFTEDDLQDYVFKGYVLKDIKFLGKLKVTLRSSQAKDLKEVDNYLMNGPWKKDANGKEKEVSAFLQQNINSMCIAALAIQKLDGASPGGETLEERMKWLEERGSAFIDMLAAKVNLFNRALTAYLTKEDSIQGS